MDDAELARITACKAGQLEQFDPLYTAHADAVYRYVLRRTLSRSVAEDITSTTFLKALSGIRSFDPQKSPFRAWLYRIARNSLIDYYRSHARRTVDIASYYRSSVIVPLAADMLKEPNGGGGPILLDDVRAM